MKLEDAILNVKCYVDRFNSWDVKEIIIDDQKAFWEIRKPGSQIQKVCLFRDGSNMCIYGDYGSYTFDKMTWLGSPYNLEYNNLGYQNEKMSHDTKNNVYVFDEDAVTEDIMDWFKDTAVNSYDYDETEINLLAEKIDLRNNPYVDVEGFCSENNCDDLIELLQFTVELYENSDDEIDFIGYLKGSNLEDFEEGFESSLWKAGKRISQIYLVSLLALKICGEKLRCQKEKDDEDVK